MNIHGSRSFAHWSVAALAALPLLLLSCRGGDDAGRILLNGRIEAPVVDLAPKVSGRVIQVLVREGDRVKAGQVLARLDLGDTAIAVERDRAGVDSASAHLRDFESGSRATEISAAESTVADRRAAVDLARREFDRQKSLLAQQVTSPQEYDIAKISLDRALAAERVSEDNLALLREGFRAWQTEQARSDVNRARSVLRQSESVASEAEILAPADGVILHRLAEPGQLLGPAQPALTMGFSDRLYVRTFIPETKLGRVKQGASAMVTVDSFPGRTFPAHVTEISPDAEFTPKPVETRRERVNLVYAAKVDLDEGWKEPLVPGQPAEVTVGDSAGTPKGKAGE